jgi:spermidine synthase
VVIGDARLQLVSAPDAEFDLIVIDAFSSDAVPVHLITREAIALYLRKLHPDGVLVFHISNRYIDLAPVLSAQAVDAKLAGAIGERATAADARARLHHSSRWVALARDPSSLTGLVELDGWQALAAMPKGRLWTDDFSDVLSVIQW